jgi:hypothetical protein
MESLGLDLVTDLRSDLNYHSTSFTVNPLVDPDPVAQQDTDLPMYSREATSDLMETSVDFLNQMNRKRDSDDLTEVRGFTSTAGGTTQIELDHVRDAHSSAGKAPWSEERLGIALKMA